MESVAKVVEHLQKAGSVVVLSGAGMSTAAGIPDFRSAGGLYGSSAMLLDRFTYLGTDFQKRVQRRELERDVKAALTMDFLQRNPLAYHEMRRGMIIGLGENQWKYTLGHVFPEILNRNGKLRLLASQNIDGLDHQVLSDKSKLFNPHGLMSVLVSEGIDEPLAVGVDDPVYQKYVELVKDNIKDIYADRSARQGKSSHKWPSKCGDESRPISLAMFGDILPQRFHKERQREIEAAANGMLRFSVKPGSVLFDRCLWTERADGSRINWRDEASSCDMMMVMGTSLSGLTIDGMAHTAAKKGTPMAVFDMTRAPVNSIGANWKEDRHFLMEGHIDKNVLKICHGMGWIAQLFDDAFLPHLCLGSLQMLKEFVDANPVDDESSAKLHKAIAAEEERERQLYEEDSKVSEVPDEESLAKLPEGDSEMSDESDEESLPKFHTAVAAKEECDGQLQEEESERSESLDEEGWVKLGTAIAAEEEPESLPTKKTSRGLKHQMKKAWHSLTRRNARGNSTKKFSR